MTTSTTITAADLHNSGGDLHGAIQAWCDDIVAACVRHQDDPRAAGVRNPRAVKRSGGRRSREPATE